MLSDFPTQIYSWQTTLLTVALRRSSEFFLYFLFEWKVDSMYVGSLDVKLDFD